MSISPDARELLEHLSDYGGGCGLDTHPSVIELFSKGYLEAYMAPWKGCFYAECDITRQGIAVAKRLN
jgi:hypothetical protein